MRRHAVEVQAPEIALDHVERAALGGEQNQTGAISGSVRLEGRFDGQTFQSTGWLDLDSVTFHEYQLTDVTGPIWLSDDRVLLGAYAAPAANNTQRM